ncbi:hypothetical protein ECC02_005624 [Trypanosoma cruzi]|uniref:Uncharacterized protein n=1 Tax=Trypanosoma cruzi TaxID=5693 RepID=A0A7J6Y3V0_TRYCR|nr:hypothetical protein ECC02_005624 [Trypanosoma cruzi]
MEFGLEGHTATMCGESIVVVGGKTAAFYLNASVFSLALSTFEWRRLVCDGAVPLPRAYHSACLHGSRLVVFGGITSVGVNDVHYNTYNVFTLADGLDSETLQQMGTDRFRDTSWLRPVMPQNFEPNGVLYILDMSISPPRWESVECTGDVPCNRSHHAAAVQGNSMYMIGGYNIYSPQTQPTVDFGCLYRLDLTSFCWTMIKLNLPLYYWGSTLTPLGGSLLCFFGGVSRVKNRESHDTFLISTETGFVQPVMENDCTPLPRTAHCAWRWGCYVYIFGGAGSVASRFFNDLHRLYVQGGSWEAVTTHVNTTPSSSSLLFSAPPPLSGCAAVVVGEHLILVGGMRSNLARVSSVFLLNMHSFTWREAETVFTNTPLPFPMPLSPFTRNIPCSYRADVSRGVQTAWRGELPPALSRNDCDSEMTMPCRVAVKHRLQQQQQQQPKMNGDERRHFEKRPYERWERELDELHKLTADWSNMITGLSAHAKGAKWTS